MRLKMTRVLSYYPFHKGTFYTRTSYRQVCSSWFLAQAYNIRILRKNGTFAERKCF